MNANSLVDEWFKMAKRDLNSAEYLLDMHPVPIEIICYHCEQSAEKMLKGILTLNNVEPPKTHDLVLLCKMCCNIDSSFEELSNSCVELMPYGVQIRYPSDMELEESDVHCALNEARKISGFVDYLISKQ